MTPKFAQYVDPIFIRVFGLLQRINDGQDPSPEQEYRLINDELGRAETQLRRDGPTWEDATHVASWDDKTMQAFQSRGLGPTWLLAKYAMVSWVDEMLLKAEHWSGKTWWDDHSLGFKYFKDMESNERFYQRANEAANLGGGDDALEVYYVCFMLGFRGLYRPQEMAKEGHDLLCRRYDVPPDPLAWASSKAELIKERRSQQRQSTRAAEQYELERKIITAKPIWGRVHVFWPWLLAILFAGLSFVTFSSR